MKIMKKFTEHTNTFSNLLVGFFVIFLLHLVLVWLAGNVDTSISRVAKIFLKMLDLLTADLSLLCVILSMIMYYKVQALLNREETAKRILASMQEDNIYKKVGLNMQIDISQNPTEMLYDLEKNVERLYELSLLTSKSVTTADNSPLFEKCAIGMPNCYQKAKLIMRYLQIQITALEIQTKNVPSVNDFKRLEKQQQDFISHASKVGYRD
ncbi:MAG: hypothetical protein Q4D07_07090 [Selenomonadaceae bacterium]|nr:hypothetical protein [Selenomonadaceae bacterium]